MCIDDFMVTDCGTGGNFSNLSTMILHFTCNFCAKILKICILDSGNNDNGNGQSNDVPLPIWPTQDQPNTPPDDHPYGQCPIGNFKHPKMAQIVQYPCYFKVNNVRSQACYLFRNDVPA